MSDEFGGDFGNYTDTAGIIVAAVQTELAANLVKFGALYGVTLTLVEGAAGTFVLLSSADSPHPDFDKIAVEVRTQMGEELIALWDAIDAAPVV